MLSDIHQARKDSRWLQAGAWLALGGGLLTSTWAGWRTASTIPEQTWLHPFPLTLLLGGISASWLWVCCCATRPTNTIAPPAWRWT